MARFQQLKELWRVKLLLKFVKGGTIIILELVNTPQIPGVSVLLHSLTAGVKVLDYINI